MTVEVIGIITALAGFLMLWRGPDLGITLLMLATLLGAAAAVKLPALGGATVLPAHALLPFYVFAVARQPHAIQNALRSLAGPKPGFWLAMFTVYCIASALLMPRLFAGLIQVFSIARDSDGGEARIILTALEPGSGNLTQSGYLAGNLILYAAVLAHAAQGALPIIVRAVLLAAAANLLFAIIDLASYAAGFPELLDLIRNANYAILSEGDIAGLKRIVGSYPEASVFGGMTLMFFAFCFELWLRGVYTRAAGILAALSFVAVLACTSSSAYVGLGVYAGLILLRCTLSLILDAASPRGAAVALLAPLLALVTLFAFMQMPAVWAMVSELVDQTLVNKLDTQSGIERSSWNEYGLRAFFDSAMLGAGAGSVRASSFLVAVLATSGLIGAGLMVAFITSLALNVMRGARSRETAAVTMAGGGACFALIVTASLVAASPDLGLSFFINAAIVTAAAGYAVRSGAPDGAGLRRVSRSLAGRRRHTHGYKLTAGVRHV